MAIGNDKHNIRRSGIIAFLSVALLIALCSLLVFFNLKQQTNMLQASGISYELRILLERCNKQINALLDHDRSAELPDRVLLRLRDDIRENAEIIGLQNKKLRPLLLKADQPIDTVLQPLDIAQTSQKLDEIDRLWEQFSSRVDRISRANTTTLRAGNKYWQPVDFLVAHNGLLFKSMSDLNKLVYQASLRQNQDLSVLYMIILGLVLFGLWLIWYMTLRPMTKRLSQSYQEIVQKNERLDFQANHDAMTGLLNRVAFNHKVEELGKRPDGLSLCSLVLLDLDEFKPINDSLGHQIGDEVLIHMSRHLQEDCLPGEFAYRIGGDEFALIIENTENRRMLTDRLDKLMAHTREPLNTSAQDIYISCSMGIAWGAQCGSSLEEIFSAADAALYSVKENGRNHYRFFDEISDVSITQQFRADQELKRAARDGEFVVHYQPIVNLLSGQLHSFEALARWQHPDRGLLLPGEWLPQSERLNLDSIITEQIMEMVASDYKRWRAEGFDCYPIAVNITENLLTSGDALKHTRAMLRDSPDKSWLSIEVTESIVFDRAFHIMKEQLELIHAEGVHISLDDFGTGFANLSHLRTIPFDSLKIDQTFTSKLLVDKGVRTIVKSLIDLSHGLGKSIVCEGVDDVRIKDLLKEMGCTYSQGFLHAKAIPFDEASRLLPTIGNAA